MSNGYSLVYYKNRNQIVIGLPQTTKTLTNTLEPMVDRRTDVEESDLMCLLQVAQVIFCKMERREDAETKQRSKK